MPNIHLIEENTKRNAALQCVYLRRRFYGWIYTKTTKKFPKFTKIESSMSKKGRMKFSWIQHTENDLSALYGKPYSLSFYFTFTYIRLLSFDDVTQHAYMVVDYTEILLLYALSVLSIVVLAAELCVVHVMCDRPCAPTSITILYLSLNSIYAI